MYNSLQDDVSEKSLGDPVEASTITTESYINETLTSNLSIESDQVVNSPLPAVTELDKIIRAGIKYFKKEEGIFFVVIIFLGFSFAYQQCGRLRNTL